MDTSDDPITAIAIGVMGYGIFSQQQAQKKAEGDRKKMREAQAQLAIEAEGQKSVEAGLSDAEARRRSVSMQIQKSKKATLIAKRDEPEPLLKSTTLGPG